MKRQNVRTLSLIVCTFTYLLIGAAVFDALESDNEVKDRDRLEKEKLTFVERYNITKDDYQLMATNIIKYMPHRAGTQWKFAGAFFFSTTVITTIGYGYSTPKTWGGKVFCMFYAMAGIPLNLVMFQSIGERLNIFFTFILRKCKKCLRLKSIEVSQTNLIIICMNMSSLVVAGGAWVFSEFESWSYLDSFYYCVITLTTIGFGDYVVLQRNDSLQKRPEYVVFSLVFILFGLAILSAAMNLLVLRFLTMNTEDERKDELEAVAASRIAVRLDGDVITSSSGHVPGARGWRLSGAGGGGLGLSGVGGVLMHKQQQHRLQQHMQQQQLPESTADRADRTSVCSCTCYNFRSNYFSLRKRKSSGGYSLTNGGSSIIAQLLQPVRVLQAMTQIHANRDSDWFAQNTIFGQRRNSI